MKKYVLLILMTAAVTAGCSQNSEPAAGMTQAIAESSVAVEESAAESLQHTPISESSYEETSTSAAESREAADTSGDIPDTEGSNNTEDSERYYRIKAEKDAVELDIEELEARYRVGETDRESFEAQRRELKAEEERLDDEEDMLEDMAEFSFYKNIEKLPEGSAEELFGELSGLKERERELEIRERELESDYREGNITRDEFISSRSEDIREEEELDMREELLERALERMGYDD